MKGGAAIRSGEPGMWSGSLRCASGVLAVQFRVRPIKVRRKNAEGLCWMIRPLDGHDKAPQGQGTPNGA